MESNGSMLNSNVAGMKQKAPVYPNSFFGQATVSTVDVPAVNPASVQPVEVSESSTALKPFGLGS